MLEVIHNAEWVHFGWRKTKPLTISLLEISPSLISWHSKTPNKQLLSKLKIFNIRSPWNQDGTRWAGNLYILILQSLHNNSVHFIFQSVLCILMNRWYKNYNITLTFYIENSWIGRRAVAWRMELAWDAVMYNSLGGSVIIQCFLMQTMSVTL